MLGFCQNWIFGQKFDFSNSVSCEVSACSQHDMQSSTLISFLQFKLDLYIMCIQREEPTLNIFCLFQISFSLEISTKRESSFLLPLLKNLLRTLKIWRFSKKKNISSQFACQTVQVLNFENLGSPLGTVFENHRKSLILHCERSELRLHFEWTKVN